MGTEGCGHEYCGYKCGEKIEGQETYYCRTCQNKRKIQEKVKELLQMAEVNKTAVGTDFEKTNRQFLVTIYEENTEFLACIEMLAEISKWFNVKPI